MKTLLILFSALCVFADAGAQGTLEFFANLTGSQEVPSNTSPNHGTGRFTLNGDFLQWSVSLDAPWFEDTGGFVHGPANPGSTAPVLFDLGNRFIVGPAPGNPGGVVYGGNRTLNGAETSDLLAGLWYANITSAAFPNGEIRGQITSVPEPSTFALLRLGTAALMLFIKRTRKSRS